MGVTATVLGAHVVVVESRGVLESSRHDAYEAEEVEHIPASNGISLREDA